MKYVAPAVLVSTLLLGACAGNSSKKANETASRAAATPTTRCPPGYLQDNQGNCIEQQQTRRRGGLRDTFDRSMDGLSIPQPALPSGGGLLGR